MRAVLAKARIILLIWSLGLLVGLVFGFLKMLKRIRIEGEVPIPKAGLIVSYRHVSFLDPFLVAFLWFPRYLFDFSLITLNVTGKERYYDKWWFGLLLLRQVCFPVKKNGGANAGVFKEMADILRGKRIITIAPEGGRKGSSAESGNLREGVGLLNFISKAPVLPVWIEVEGKSFAIRKISLLEIFRLIWQLFLRTKMIIRVGDLQYTGDKKRKEATWQIRASLELLRVSKYN